VDEAAEAREPDATSEGPIRGLFRSLTQLLATAIGIAQTRVELLSTELQEEVHRVAEIMVWTLVVLLSAGIGLFLLALLVIFVFWDTHRVLAAVSVTGVFAAVALIGGVVLRAKIKGKPRLLDATLSELAKDRASLLSRR
jgi:uncharacterized membrane protein YqjE